jgi:hypothetical protein
MPITYERDDERRLITVTVTEPYSVDDLLPVIDRQAAEHTWEYAMLIDRRSGTFLSDEADLQRVANRIETLGAGRTRGPVGIAMTNEPARFRRILKSAVLARNRTAFEVVLTDAQLAEWLARNAPSRKA